MKAVNFTHKDIENVLFHDTCPEVTVYPFWKSSVEALRLLPIRVALNSRHLDDRGMQAYVCVAKITKQIKNTPITEKELLPYLASANSVLSGLIFIETNKVFVKWRDFFYDNLVAFTEDTASKFQWEIVQAIGVEHVIKPPFSSEQQMWIAYASTWSKSREHKFITDVAESLHVWMNVDLFKQIEKIKDTKRDNTQFDEQHKAMLSGTFGLPEGDKAIIAKLEREMQMDDDLDIIK